MIALYIMKQGSKPTGECFLTPTSDGGQFVGQYYDGSNVKLLRFKQTQTVLDIDDIEKRLTELEEFRRRVEPLIHSH